MKKEIKEFEEAFAEMKEASKKLDKAIAPRLKSLQGDEMGLYELARELPKGYQKLPSVIGAALRIGENHG